MIHLTIKQVLQINLLSMQETIKFLGTIDSKLRRQSLDSTPKASKKLATKLPFAKLFEFESQKFEKYPSWLTQRQDFFKFMYQNYEQKLMTIPKICLKSRKESDQKYFVSLYLQQIPIFQQLPPTIMEVLLENVISKSFKSGDIIHEEGQQLEYMAVIFVGSVAYKQKSHTIDKIQNQMIMTEAFYGKTHQQIVAKQETILLAFPKRIYPQIQSKMLSQILQKQKDQVADLIKSDFFIQLHLKDEKARSFFRNMKLEFYFKGETITVAGDMPEKFYIIFKGDILEKNHIYIRQHNKWPLPYRRWEVRAVYNSFENIEKLSKHNFFADEQIINALRLKSSHIAKSHTLLFSMEKDLFIDSLNTEDFKRLKKYRNEHVNVNYTQFQRSVRQKVKSHHERKKIVHKAIDASFINRRQFPKKRLKIIDSLEKQMTQSIQKDLLETRNDRSQTK